MVESTEAENGKKLQQSGSGSAPGEEYTHGGVKKTKFEPKVPLRRLKKLSAPKSELPLTESALGPHIPKELQRLLQQQGRDSEGHRRRQDSHGHHHPRTSTVAFGFSGGSSQSKGSVGKERHGGTVVGGSEPLEAIKLSAAVEKAEKQENQAKQAKQAKQDFLRAEKVAEQGERKTLEIFDHEKYFPVTLPLRKPVPGVDTRRLDEEEFGGEGEGEDEDEDEGGAEAAQELGLKEPKDEDTLFFFQFPKRLPISLSSSGKEKPPSSRGARLEDLRRGGAMGKLLVYESGAVKLKVGDVVFDALPGTECTFAQEVAAVNTTSKQCSFIGGVHQRVVLMPDVVDVLPDLTDLRTKR